MTDAMRSSKLPIHQTSVDWPALLAKFPVPNVFEETVYRWPAERIRALQNERFLDCVAIGWENEFYR